MSQEGHWLDTTRYKRVRQLVRAANKKRRLQAKQIDILCNDMVDVHGDFVRRLMSLEFVATFYRGLLGCNDLTSVLDIAANLISDGVRDSNVAIFLLESDGFELHMTDDDGPIEVQGRSLEGSFTAEAVKNISATGRICTLGEMFELGLSLEKAGDLSELSAVAVPLRRLGPTLGFILVSRRGQCKLTPGEVEKISAITSGLCSAIDSMQNTQKTSGLHD